MLAIPKSKTSSSGLMPLSFISEAKPKMVSGVEILAVRLKLSELRVKEAISGFRDPSKDSTSERVSKS